MKKGYRNMTKEKKGYGVHSGANFCIPSFMGRPSAVHFSRGVPLTRGDRIQYGLVTGGGALLGGLGGGLAGNTSNDPNLSNDENSRNTLINKTVAGGLGALGGATLGSAGMGGKWLIKDIKHALRNRSQLTNDVPRPIRKMTGSSPDITDSDPWGGGGPRRPPYGPGPAPWDGGNPWDD
jgi:hypothetical protein